jgi:putative ABC transport system ATP-binding protein
VRERPLLKGLSFSLDEGERLVLGGPSGLGKTTLLRALAGLIDPLSGQILLRGREAGADGWPEYRRRVLQVSQIPAFFEGSVKENLARPFSFRSVQSPYDEQRARVLLDEAGLGPTFLDESATELSVGQQQRVSLVRALLLEPEMMLLDEPTSGLDEASRRAVEGLLVEAGTACVIVTHEEAFAERIGARRLDLAPYAANPEERAP